MLMLLGGKTHFAQHWSTGSHIFVGIKICQSAYLNIDYCALLPVSDSVSLGWGRICISVYVQCSFRHDHVGQWFSNLAIPGKHIKHTQPIGTSTPPHLPFPIPCSHRIWPKARWVILLCIRVWEPLVKGLIGQVTSEDFRFYSKYNTMY